MSELRLGFVFWLMVLFALAFARYVVLAVRDGDGQLAVYAAIALALMCLLAALEAFGTLW